MKNPAFIFIGGSPLQEAAFGYARELSVPVFLIDRAKNPHCRPLASMHYPIDGTDVPSISQAALSLAGEHQIAGAYCNNDFGLIAAATLNEVFSLPGPSLSSATLCHDKRLMRDKLSRAGVPIPKGIVVPRGSNAASLAMRLESLNFPVVVKPNSGSGSAGIEKIASAEPWMAHLSERAHSESLIVEEFIAGTHHDINALMIDGRFFPCGVADRFFGAHNYPVQNGARISECLPVCGAYPSALSPQQIAEAYGVVEAAARALGIDHSPVKADLIWSERGPVLLEIAPRFHGEIVSAYLMPSATGHAPIRDWLRYLTTGEYRATDPDDEGCSVWLAILPPEGGSIPAEAARKIRSQNEMVMLDWRFDRSTRDGTYRDNRDVRGLFVTRGRDSDETRGRAKKVLEDIFAAMDGE